MFVNLNIQAEESKKTQDKNFGNLPVSGIFRISVNDINFNMLTIKSDDTSVADRYWQDNFFDPVLEKWVEWTSAQGTYIDVGAHTGLFTIAALVSNKRNQLVTIEPFDLNYNRIISNLRLNNFNNKNAALFKVAISNKNKNVKFKVTTPWSYLSKGGKISNEGVDVSAIALDSLNFTDPRTIIKGIKIDTEGEDLMVLKGAENLIQKFMPKLIIEVRRNNAFEILNFLNDMNYNKIYDIYENNITDISSFKFKNDQESIDIFCEF